MRMKSKQKIPKQLGGGDVLLWAMGIDKSIFLSLDICAVVAFHVDVVAGFSL